MRSNQIDSLIYFRGISIKSILEASENLKGLPLKKIVELIENRTELNSNIHSDEIQNFNFSARLVKSIEQKDTLKFSLEIVLRNTENFREGDDLYFEIRYENLRGKVYSVAYVGVEVNGKFIKNGTKKTSLWQLKKDCIRRVTASKVKPKLVLSESIYMKYSSMKITIYRHFRGDEVINEIFR